RPYCHQAGADSVASLIFPHPAASGTYALSLHDALPISAEAVARAQELAPRLAARAEEHDRTGRFSADDLADLREAGLLGLMTPEDRKSTRLNSSHVKTSYAVFCLKKKKKATRKGQLDTL